MARVFISYKRGAVPDERLAAFFTAHLEAQGHDVFLDRRIPLGEEWPTVIRRELECAGFLLVLVSRASAVSEMVIEEVAVAHRRYRQSGAPVILPVRVQYSDDPPYDLAAIIGRLQCGRWERDGDELDIAGLLPIGRAPGPPAVPAPPSMPPPEMKGLSADGFPVPIRGGSARPAPSFDSNCIEKLDPPGGAVRLDSPFYVTRAADARIEQLLHRSGVTILVKGARQVGKTSLLARLCQEVRDAGHTPIFCDFQRIDDDSLRDLPALLAYLGRRLARALRTERSPADRRHEILGPADDLSHFIEEAILGEDDRQIWLVLDEVDRLFSFPFRDSFFGLLRSWHNERAISTQWARFNLVVSYSTEAFLFITDLHQSPFNVGEPIDLEDFDAVRVAHLNRLHGEPIKQPDQLNELKELLGGHPFLVRRALYDLALRKYSFGEMCAGAESDDGPFADHLHRHLLALSARTDLRQGLKSVIEEKVCPSDSVFYQLRAAGLVTGPHRSKARMRNGLYERYFGCRI